MKKYSNWILDLDDTLVYCSSYYLQCQKEFVDYQVDRTTLPESFVANLRNQMDLVFTQMQDGFNRNRFPRSFKAASMSLDVIRGKEIDHVAAEYSFLIGNKVFNAPYDFFADSIPFLNALQNGGSSVFLLTKGDQEVQTNKIKSRMITSYIPWSNIYIVPKKSGDSIRKIITSHRLLESDTIMVGDSVRDDIGSAIDAGVDSAHIWRTDRTLWAYENTDHKSTYTVETLDELHKHI